MTDWEQPLVGSETPLQDALAAIDESGCQFILVVDQNGRLLGTLSDGNAMLSRG